MVDGFSSLYKARLDYLVDLGEAVAIWGAVRR